MPEKHTSLRSVCIIGNYYLVSLCSRGINPHKNKVFVISPPFQYLKMREGLEQRRKPYRLRYGAIAVLATSTNVRSFKRLRKARCRMAHAQHHGGIL